MGGGRGTHRRVTIRCAPVTLHVAGRLVNDDAGIPPNPTDTRVKVSVDCAEDKSMRSPIFQRLKTALRTKVVRKVVSRFKVPRDVVRFGSKRYGPRVALIVGETRFTYAELQDRYLRLATAWREAGIVKGSVVFCLLPDTAELVEIRLAGYETGVLLTQFHIDSGTERVLNAAATIRPAVFIYDPRLDEPCAQALRDLNPDVVLWPIGPGLAYEAALEKATPTPSNEVIESTHPLGVSFSSGTTGAPKAMVTGHGKLIASMQLVIKNVRIELGSAPDVAMAGIPLTGAGSGLILPTLLSGGALVIAPRYEAAALAEQVEKHRVTRLFLTPSMLIDLLDLEPGAHDMSSLTNVIYGSEIMPAAKIAEAIRRFGPILQQGYGSAEVMPPVSMLQPHQHVDANGEPVAREILASAGTVIGEVGVRIVDDGDRVLPTGAIGRILVKSPTVFDGYLGAGPQDAPAEWFALGDVGYIDAANRLHVMGRLADVVRRSSGAVTYPRTVEEVLHEHEAVKECCMVQVGDEAILVVSPRRHYADRITADCDGFAKELRILIAKHVAPGDTPDQIVVVADLPRSVLAKVVRREIRDHLKAGTLQLLGSSTNEQTAASKPKAALEARALSDNEVVGVS